MGTTVWREGRVPFREYGGSGCIRLDCFNWRTDRFDFAVQVLGCWGVRCEDEDRVRVAADARFRGFLFLSRLYLCEHEAIRFSLASLCWLSSRASSPKLSRTWLFQARER